MTLPGNSVCIYAEGAQNRAHFDRGIPRYVGEHVRALYAGHRELLHSVLLSPELPLTGNLSWLLGTGLVGWSTDDRRVAARPRSTPLVYHIMSPFELGTSLEVMWPRWARDRRVATVVTLYDLIPLVFEDHYLKDPRLCVEYEARLEFIRQADQVLAISQTTADDAVERLGIGSDRVHVVHAGSTDTFTEMYATADAAWAKLRDRLAAIRPGFMLYVGGFEFRKNLEGLIDAYSMLPAAIRARHQLVIACRIPPDQMDVLSKRAGRAGLLPGELVVTGYVPDAELGALYHTCDLFVFASLYEGSGLPMLEAMACGAPVAASNTSTPPEILGDDEATFNPHEPASIADCLLSVIDSPATLERLAERSRARVRAYTWAQVATESVEAYTRALGRRPRLRSHRARIALVTPWPAERSGIADYNVRLAAELGKQVDVDIVTARPADEYPRPLEQGVRVIGASDYRWLAPLRQHDRVVYCMGNSLFHDHVYELLRQRPGAVVLHDVQLTGFYGWRSGREHPEEPAIALASKVRSMYGARLPAEATDEQPLSWERQLALGIYLTREIQGLAEECFVHSRFASDLLELDRGSLDRGSLVRELPFGMPAPLEGLRERRGAVASPLIVSMGVVNEVKGIASLISAFAIVAAERPAARLVVAGPTDDAESRRWHDYAREHAPGANIEIPGHVDAERYRSLLREADLAIQLRLVANGEASAAIADCLSAGLPTLVTDVGWAGELPSDAVAHVALGIEPAALADRIERLLLDDVSRSDLSAAALRHVSANSFARVAEAYIEALELN
jgi:glycosyltransferase involved in cell wall biosynthesis